MCGRSRQAHNQHVRFRLPDPVVAAPQQDRTPGTWMSHGDATSSVMLQVPGIGPFVRVLLPVTLTGGDTLTFGVWLGLEPADMQRAFEEWWARLGQDPVRKSVATACQVWRLVGVPHDGRCGFRKQPPRLHVVPDASFEHELRVRGWDHDEVLDALPEALR